MVLTQTGTPYYASPEVWKDKPYDSKSDIWSLGWVLYEMTTLKPPFTAKDMKSLYMKVVRGQYPDINKRYSTDLGDTISKWLQTSPSKRATADTLINSQELRDHVWDIKDGTDNVELQSPKTNLLNTIKLPKKLLDITKRLPKSNYCSPLLTSNKKILDIRIAKGLPEIFEKPSSQISSGRSLRRKLVSESWDETTPKVSNLSTINKASNEISQILRSRLYKRVMKPESNNSPKVDFTHKIRLPKIERTGPKGGHNYSVNYSWRSLSNRRDIMH